MRFGERQDGLRTLGLAVLGACVLAASAALDGDLLADRARFVALHGVLVMVCGLAALLVWRGGRRRDLVLILAVAAAARLLLVTDAPTLSNDAYRFVWDGRVQAQGINPYSYAPADKRLRRLRDYRVFTKVNRPHVRTLYPPTNEIAFFAATRAGGESLTAIKAAWLGAEALAVALLLLVLARAGTPRERVVLYAWHPLALVEIAGSGHPEALMTAFVLATLLAWHARRGARAGAALAAATFVKFAPLLLAPMLARRLGWRLAAGFAGCAALLYLPYAGAGLDALGSVSEFRDERFGAGPLVWLEGIGAPDTAARAALVAAALAGVALATARPPHDLAGACRSAAFIFGGVLLASHYVQPWYLLWVLPLLCVAPIPALLWASGTVSLFYLALGSHDAIAHDTIGAIVWGPTVALLAAQWLPALRLATRGRGRQPAGGLGRVRPAD